MGNRAVITFESMPEVGIYLHWNGGPESVLAFIEITRQRGARAPKGDSHYAFARLTQTIAEFFSTTGDYVCSVGVGPTSQLDVDNGDNGQYVIANDWTIKSNSYSQILKVDSLGPDGRGKYLDIVSDAMERTVPKKDYSAVA